LSWACGGFRGGLSVFQSRVGTHTGARFERRVRADVDDPPLPALPQKWNGRVAGEQGAFEIDGKHLVPDCRVACGDRLPTERSGNVDEDVEPLQLLVSGPNSRRGLRLIGKIDAGEQA
jgi:hypothetical protein